MIMIMKQHNGLGAELKLDDYNARYQKSTPDRAVNMNQLFGLGVNNEIMGGVTQVVAMCNPHITF